jgi:hypothetical protein
VAPRDWPASGGFTFAASDVDGRTHRNEIQSAITDDTCCRPRRRQASVLRKDRAAGYTRLRALTAPPGGAGLGTYVMAGEIKCREILGDEAVELSDVEVDRIRRHADLMAHVIIDVFLEQRAAKE